MDIFGSELIVKNFEDEEIDGHILLLSTVRANEAMETSGLKAIGKRGKVVEKTKELAGIVILTNLWKFFSLVTIALIFGCVGRCSGEPNRLFQRNIHSADLKCLRYSELIAVKTRDFFSETPPQTFVKR